MLRMHPHLEQRLVHPITASPGPIAGILGAFFRSLADCLAASREYERQRAWGVPHNDALRIAFGLTR